MLKYINFDIVFQEVPDEITLAINISRCPNHCAGCHSPYLWADAGEMLDETVLDQWLALYGMAITCFGFMGGDAEPERVEQLARYVHRMTDGKIKTAWYSGRETLPSNCRLDAFNYIKLGPYIASLGGLSTPTTNQKMYRVEQGLLIDITHRFQPMP
jgi:anaerobic ribonucleoside-triphosphate reductase activating protein